MICYKDKTFCKFYENCKHGINCDKALTPEVLSLAYAWWNGKNAPISVYLEKPDCYESINLNHKEKIK